MAKPEEVIVVEDENGNVVRDVMKDSDVLAQYKQMRETLVYLSHLDHSDTQNQVCTCISFFSGFMWLEPCWNTFKNTW